MSQLGTLIKLSRQRQRLKKKKNGCFIHCHCTVKDVATPLLYITFFAYYSTKLCTESKIRFRVVDVATLNICRLPNCTDGNTVFRCDSDKNSFVIISMF